MTLVGDVAKIAAECVKTPGRVSVWDPKLGKFICERDPRFREVSQYQSGAHADPISPEFKLVFLTAAFGTFLFVAICVATTIAAGKDMPPAWEKLVQSLMDLAKIGFGAVAGLLGGKA